MITSYKNKSRSQQRREAVQRGKKLPTFSGSKVQPQAKPADPHVHINEAAHKALNKMVEHAKKTSGKKVNRKDLASEAILDFAKQPSR